MSVAGLPGAAHRGAAVRVRVALAALLVLAALFGLAGSAAAAAPRLSDRVTDQTGALAGHEAEIAAALARLEKDRGIQLWVLFVPSTGGTSITAYADQVAAANSLGVNDVLQVVALNDRTDALWVSDGLPQITTAEIDAIISGAVEPRLAAGDSAGAVVAAADGLDRAAGGTLTPSAAPTSGPAAPSGATAGSDTAGSLLTGVVAAVLILVGLYIVFVVVLRRRAEARTEEEQDRVTGDIARRANHDLIAADEAVRNGQQELGFVEAQFDDPDAAPFRAALEQAANEVKAAFLVRQQLDDEVPESPPARQAMLEEILRHTTAVAALLRTQEDRLAQLRDIQRRAPDVLAQLATQADTLSARLEGSRATLDRLTAFAPASWASVKGNAAEAEKRIGFGRDAVARGRAGLDAKDQRATAIAIRDGQGALGEAAALLDAVDRLAASIDDAQQHLPAELAAAAADIETAQQAIASGGAGAAAGAGAGASGAAASSGGAAPSGATSSGVAGDQQQKLAEARRLLDAARAAAAATPPDVLTAFQQATQANAAADAVVAAMREEAARIARRQAVLDGALRSAAMAVAQAGDFIETRRGGVGREARTRLVDAQQQLDAAKAAAASDPDAAIQAAQRAQATANEAYLMASRDFTQFDQRGPNGYPYGYGNGGADMAGAIIGGIIGGILSGGRGGFTGWGGGGWGGTPWGSPPQSGGGPRGGGIGSFGGFGGSGPGRTVGGSWGGLGGRSRGGRW